MFMLMFSHIKVGFVNDTDARLAPASVKLYSAVVNSAAVLNKYINCKKMASQVNKRLFVIFS